MEISFSNKLVKDNEKLPLKLVQTKPIVDYNFRPKKYYSLIMVDHDAPSKDKPVNKYWLHWMMINIDENGLGDEIMLYEPAYPPEGSGYHRYSITMFEQPYYIEIRDAIKFVGKSRAKFSPLQFKKMFDLKSLDRIMFLTKRD